MLCYVAFRLLFRCASSLLRCDHVASLAFAMRCFACFRHALLRLDSETDVAFAAPRVRTRDAGDRACSQWAGPG
eukprot:3580748-Rhodomonas_salina.2